MNTGVTAYRYAKALLSFVMEGDAREKVYSQAGMIVQKMEAVPQFKEYVVRHDEISEETKLELLQSALDEPLADELVRFVRVVTDNRRMDLFYRMLWSFIYQYREAFNIKVGKLVVPSAKDDVHEKLESVFHDRTSCDVYFHTTVDPDIIGGFMLEIDGYRLDATVRSQLERIRRRLIDETDRLV